MIKKFVAQQKPKTNEVQFSWESIPTKVVENADYFLSINSPESQYEM